MSGVTRGVCGAAGRTAAKRYSRVKKVSEMPAVHAKAQTESLTLTDLLPLCAEALTAAESFGAAAQRAVARRVATGGKVDADLLEREQFAAHGFAWLAPYLAPLPDFLSWRSGVLPSGQRCVRTC